MDRDKLIKITADIVAEYAATNRLSNADLPNLIQSTYDALTTLGAAPEAPETGVADRPAVSVRKSIADPNFIISMIDGKPYTTLKKHLARHGFTPAEYRERFALQPDYPMTAPAYSERRSALAKQIGLGRKAGDKPSTRKSAPKRKKSAPSYR
jgi:predicted transcriptional regulator